MGIEYRGQLCVGYTRSEFDELVEGHDFPQDVDLDDVVDIAERLGLESFSPYFDADLNDCIFGVSLAQGYDYDATLVQTEKLLRVDALIGAMFDEYGHEPKVYIMAEVR